MVRHHYNTKLDIPSDADSARFFVPAGYTARLEEGVLVVEPEESDDERIRKALIDGVRQIRCKNGITQEQMIAYLERQKDSPMPEDTVVFQKGVEEGRRLEREDLPYWQTFKGIGIIVPDDYILAKFGKGYKLLSPGDTIEIGTEFLQVSQLVNLPKEEQHKEQKPAEKQDYSSLNGLERAIHRGFLSAGVENVPVTIIKETAQECLSQMKPAEWSDTDNIGWDEAFACVIRAEKAAKNEEELQNAVTAEKWLKEIKFKYYVNPVKQEWSEEDKKILDSLIRLYSREYSAYAWPWANGAITYGDVVNLLKSLRPSWKPSEEQMGALNYAYCELFKRGDVDHNILGPLQNLIDTLSKL